MNPHAPLIFIPLVALVCAVAILDAQHLRRRLDRTEARAALHESDAREAWQIVQELRATLAAQGHPLPEPSAF